MDDHRRLVIVQETFYASNITLVGLPSQDCCTAFASVAGYEQAECSSINLLCSVPATHDLMLLPCKPSFDFSALTWDVVKKRAPFLAPQGRVSEAVAEQKFYQLLGTDRSKSLACMMNLVAAMEPIDLFTKSPLSYIRRVRWDYEFPTSVTFFAYCDATLISDLEKAGTNGQFKKCEFSTSRPKAPINWRQNIYSQTNLHLNLYTDPAHCITSIGWVTLAPTMGHKRVPVAAPPCQNRINKFEKKVRSPAEVFVQRWMEHRRLGLPDFDPGYVLNRF